MLLVLATGCRPLEENGTAPAASQPERSAPQPVHILGQIQLRGETDAGGIQVYIPGSSLLAITGADGRFNLAGASPGRHEIWARAEGYQPVVLGEVNVAAADDRKSYSLSPVTLDFQQTAPAPPAASTTRSQDAALGSLSGRLVPAEGVEAPESWSGATIELDKTPYRTTAAPDGAFLLWNLPADRYMMTVRLEGFVSTSTAVRVLPGAQATTLTVPMTSESAATGGSFMALRTYPAEIPGALRGVMAAAAVTSATTASTGSIRGVARYHRDDVQDHSGISITLTGSSQAATTAEDGAYALENVAPGQYQLLARAEGYEPARVPIDLAAGDTLEINPILLEPHLDYPRVIQAIPNPGVRDVTIAREIPFLIRFSKKMDPESLRRAVNIEPKVSWQAFTGRDSPDTDFDVIKIVIYGAMQPMTRFDTPYRITITQAASDFEGLNLQEPFALNFRTGRAKIYRTTPVDGASGISMSQLVPVTVNFNAPIDSRSVRPELISITPRPENTPLIALRQDPSTGWTNLIITATWRPDTAYRVTIERAIRTISNSPIVNTPYHFRFKTARLVLPSAPSVPKGSR